MPKGDQSRAEYPLGVMLANECIDNPQHSAGCRYAWLFAVVHGKDSVATVNFLGVSRGRTPDIDDPDYQEWLAERERELKDAEAALPSRQAVDMVRSICVYGRFPRWILPVIPKDRDVRDAAKLTGALRTLARTFGYDQQKAAA